MRRLLVEWLDVARDPVLRGAADEPGDVRTGGERAVAPAAQHDGVHRGRQVLEGVPQRLDDPAVDGVDGRIVEPDGLDHAVAVSGANISRSSVLRNLPTLVFGISATNSYRSGSHHFAKFGSRHARSSSAVADWP